MQRLTPLQPATPLPSDRRTLARKLGLLPTASAADIRARQTAVILFGPSLTPARSVRRMKAIVS
ncbi:MAG: hypothetical protein L0Y72_18580 [Gemmataceae bacterium]|nr:hypothetical protein [Gemmataceae bacterium]